MRTQLLLIVVFVVVFCVADKTQVFTGVVPEGKASVTILYGSVLPGFGLLMNSNANSSHTLSASLNSDLEYSVWSAEDSMWEATWTATACEASQDKKTVSIIFACHKATEVSACAPGTAYAITVTEYNTTLPPWNPDNGALRWNVQLGGLQTTVSWNLTFDLENSKTLDKRSDLHISISTIDGKPSSAAAALYSFGAKDEEGECCQLWDEDPEDQSAFKGSSAMFLAKISIDTTRQYILVFNGSQPRDTYEFLIHATESARKKTSNIWVFVAVAVGCFVVGAILAVILASFFWHGDRDKDRTPLLREQLIK